MAHDQNPRTATVTILNKSWVKNIEPSTHYMIFSQVWIFYTSVFCLWVIWMTVGV